MTLLTPEGAPCAAQKAAAALSGARTEAARATAAAQRHQQAVARLTADNMLFLMRARKCEAELEALLQERDQLRRAVEQQKGPWFDKVGLRCGCRALDLWSAGFMEAVPPG